MATAAPFGHPKQLTNSTDETKTHANKHVNSKTSPCPSPLPNSLVTTQPQKMPFKAPKPGIKKPQTAARRRQSTNQARELESKLTSGLTVAAGGITTLTNNLIARQSPELMHHKVFSQYITKLRSLSEELKGQLNTLGRCSKLSSQHDHNSFHGSYRSVLALWKEYQRVSAYVVQSARVWKRDRAERDSSDSTAVSSSNSEAGTAPGEVPEGKLRSW